MDNNEINEKEEELSSPVSMAETFDSALNNNENKPVFCMKCGTKMENGRQFCPACGHRVGGRIEPLRKSGSSKKLILIIAAIAVLAAVVTVVIILVQGKKPQEVTLNKSSVTVKVGESMTLSFTINPEDAKDKTVSWTTSNDAIATVSEGKVVGRNEGDCEITITTSNGKTDSCSVVVEKAGPDFQAIYDEYCKSSFAKVANDKSYLFIDTNPSNKKEDMDYEAYLAILSINKALGLPESVENRMGQTRSLDGVQTASGDGFDVSWTYHPNNGLEVTYSLTK